METAELQTRVEALEAALKMATAVNSEAFYWWCTALMVAIHAGFLAYEMGASRAKNALASGMKNLVAFAFLVPFFYFVGWFIYNAFPTGFTISAARSREVPDRRPSRSTNVTRNPPTSPRSSRMRSRTVVPVRRVQP